MVLSGTLREFILADVMQLLTQQKITGKLILINGTSEGHIVFRNGIIVSAVREKEHFPMKLFYFLTEMRQQSKTKVREVFSSYENNVAGLTAFVENKGLLSHDELENYATNVTIDITCSLFLWKRGNYRFDSMPSVDHLIPARIEIPVENVVMEAMRRIDEWHRMREAINEETIFSHTGKQIDLLDDRDTINDPSPYFFHRIDGTTDVKTLLKDSFLTDYKIYDTLYQMMQDELIHPLSDSVTRSIRAAMLKKGQQQSVNSFLPPLIAAAVSIGIIVLIVLVALLLRGVFFSQLQKESSQIRNEITLQDAGVHFNDAALFRRSTSLSPFIPGNREIDFYSISRKEKLLILKKDIGLPED